MLNTLAKSQKFLLDPALINGTGKTEITIESLILHPSTSFTLRRIIFPLTGVGGTGGKLIKLDIIT
jgi:hypothetical protein